MQRFPAPTPVLAGCIAASIILAASCGPGSGPDEGATTSGSAGPAGHAEAPDGEAEENAGVRLEHLTALPYVALDPDADTSLRGVTRYDRDRAWPGFNLHTNDVNRVFLTDLNGSLVHGWQVPASYQRCEHAEFLDDGGILVVCVDQGLIRLDWSSRVVWEVKLQVHHDVTLRSDGSILVPYHTQQPWQGRNVWFDYILSLSPEGKILGRWSTFDHLEALRAHHDPSPLDTAPGPGADPVPVSLTGVDYYHLNTVEALPATPLGERDRRFRPGNILISLRNASVIMVLDREDFSIQWSWGRGELELQHMPTMLDSGHILIFDNGTYREWSRVVEMDPATGRIVWEYRGDPPEAFYSKWRGSNQRFPNGNTLICESERGHVFEVAENGEIVWEFWNPDLVGGSRRRIYRLLRVPAERVLPFLELRAGP